MSAKSVPDPKSHSQGDPFADLNRLRLSQDFTATAGVKRLLTTVPVRKPNGQDFIRVHPDEAYRLQTLVLELKEEREIYLVAPDLRDELCDELKPVTLFTTINRQGVLFLWPIRLPGEDGRIDEWNRSAHEAAGFAATRWIRVKASLSLGAYATFEAMDQQPEPHWSDIAFESLLRIAFKGRYIESLDHPVIRRLRGEA